MGKIDVEKWISELKWSEDATDREKTLVAGNIRAFASAIGYYNNVLSIDQLTDRLYEVKNWQTTQPPNEVTVEVEDGDRIIQVQAYYGRDGMRPHWRTPDGVSLWDVDAFRRWRYSNGT